MAEKLKAPFETLAQVLVGSLIALTGVSFLAYSVFMSRTVSLEAAMMLLAVGLYLAFGFDVRTLAPKLNGKLRKKPPKEPLS